jgi:hypothetical protein
MNLTRQPDLETVVMDAMRQSFAQDERTVETPIHLSDLLMPRYAYWQRVAPKPLTDDEIGYFVSGRSMEDATWRLHGYQKGGERVEWGITFRPDWYSSIPVEFKSRRGWLPKDDTEALNRFSHYIEQAGGYAALTEQTAAWLWVFSLAEKQADRSTKPEFRCYLCEWTKEELDEIRSRLLIHHALLTRALSERDHEGLPLCPTWKCGKSARSMIVKPHCMTCHRDFEGEWGIQKHLDSKTGRGHTTRPAEYQRAYLPRCKWFSECEPWRIDSNRTATPPMGTEIAEPDEATGEVMA